MAWKVKVIGKDEEVLLSFEILSLLRLLNIDVRLREARIYGPRIKTITIENLEKVV